MFPGIWLVLLLSAATLAARELHGQALLLAAAQPGNLSSARSHSGRPELGIKSDLWHPLLRGNLTFVTHRLAHLAFHAGQPAPCFSLTFKGRAASQEPGTWLTCSLGGTGASRLGGRWAWGVIQVRCASPLPRAVGGSFWVSFLHL